jgi:hypothetical protein
MLNQPKWWLEKRDYQKKKKKNSNISNFIPQWNAAFNVSIAFLKNKVVKMSDAANSCMEWLCLELFLPLLLDNIIPQAEAHWQDDFLRDSCSHL